MRYLLAIVQFVSDEDELADDDDPYGDTLDEFNEFENYDEY